MERVSAVYKITNTITGECYIGSSRDVKTRWAQHMHPSRWIKQPNNKLYKDIQRYGFDKFSFIILKEVEPKYLKQVEQEFMESLHPTYNNRCAKGLSVKRCEKYKKSYRESHKESHKEYMKKYNQYERVKEANKKYYQSVQGKTTKKKYRSQLCLYSGETLTIHALSLRFIKAGISHPNLEAKKYLIK